MSAATIYYALQYLGSQQPQNEQIKRSDATKCLALKCKWCVFFFVLVAKNFCYDLAEPVNFVPARSMQDESKI